MTELKQLRTEKKLTQAEAADRIGVSLRSYISYENDVSKSESVKDRFLLSELKKINLIDEEHGIVSLDDIKNLCGGVFKDYAVDYCYLFGSYAKGSANESSDIDLLISSNVTGLDFFGLVERLREVLHKRIDLLDFKQFMKNEELANEILKYGIKIYG